MQPFKIESYFPGFKINKKQEIERLIYEISKRDRISSKKIIKSLIPGNFDTVKRQLLKKRYPYSSLHNEINKPYLPKFSISPDMAFNIKKSKFSPKRILVERAVKSSYLTDNFKKSFPHALIIEIESLKKYKKFCKNPDYNKRRETIIITEERYDFFKKCPCTKGSIYCGYHIFNLGFGCISDCTYCFLQEYTNSLGIIFPVNIESFFEKFKEYKRPGMRIGTGEFSDSLMLDHITEYSPQITGFFRNYPDVVFEFKTKSSNIENLLKVKHAGNIVVSWSLNPQRTIDKNEFLTANLQKRLRSAERCAKAGYKIGFHFDPIIYSKAWEKEYKDVIDNIFCYVKPKDIAWISLGTFRFKPELKPIIENRFPSNEILDEELLLGFDNKLRYPDGIRQKIYSSLLKSLKKHSKKLHIYLCMEESSMWNDLRMNPYRPHRPGRALSLAYAAANA